MDKYTYDVLNLLKSKFENVVGVFPYRSVSEMQKYWLANYENNLIHPMNHEAKKAYDEGAGSEIRSGKIGALKSSSALTYNLFWNQTANIVNAQSYIGNGAYTVEFEKKFKTIRTSSFPAHLDAFLYCSETSEAIACEMKMTEWIFNKPSKMKASYLKPSNYIDPDAGIVFAEIAKKLAGKPILRKDGTCVEYESYLQHYDAPQMFKHTVSLYRACYEQGNNMPNNIRNLTLLNCAWTLNSPDKLANESSRRKYAETWSKEVGEFDWFTTEMRPIKELFKNNLGIVFDIRLCTFTELLNMLDKTPAELCYLERYIV